jgi:hypothetical protein
MTISEAQKDMRSAYYGGAAGVLVSSAAWLAAGAVSVLVSPAAAVVALLAGGMVIHPVSVLLAKAAGRPGKHTPGNPLAPLALEGTVWLLLSLPLAYAVSRLRVEWFFPAMLLVIGGRYFTFSTLYGVRAYGACGAALATAGMLLVRLHGTATAGAFAGGAIEAAFAVILFSITRKELRHAGSAAGEVRPAASPRAAVGV